MSVRTQLCRKGQTQEHSYEVTATLQKEALHFLCLLLSFFTSLPVTLLFFSKAHPSFFSLLHYFFFCDSFKGLLVIGVGGFGVADLDSGGMLCG